ncbi:hypothetical protein [Streptomyces sp. NPDC051310]
MTLDDLTVPQLLAPYGTDELIDHMARRTLRVTDQADSGSPGTCLRAS